MAQLAQHLSDHGLDVIAHDTFRGTATSIAPLIKAGDDVALVFTGSVPSALLPWISRATAIAPSAVIALGEPHAGESPVPVDSPSTVSLETPCTVADVLHALSIPGAGVPNALIDSDGNLTPLHEDAEAESLDNWDDLIEDLPQETVASVDPHSQGTGDLPFDTPYDDDWGSPQDASGDAAYDSLHDDVDEHYAPLGNDESPNGLRPVASSQPALSGSMLTTPVIFCIAAKGGVSKTTSALLLAERIAQLAPTMRVVLIDGNRGQGDTSSFLYLRGTPLPTIYDVATGTPASDVIITPNRLNAARKPGMTPLSFALVMAPPAGMSDAALVSSSVYADVLTAARAQADLVIVDTQIMETSDTSGLFDDVWIPALSTYAHALALTEVSKASIDNLLERLAELEEKNVPLGRVATLVTKVDPDAQYNLESLKKRLAEYSLPLGVVNRDEAIPTAMNRGSLPWDHHVIAPQFDRLIFRVTGNPAFAPKPVDAVEEPEPKRRWWMRGR